MGFVFSGKHPLLVIMTQVGGPGLMGPIVSSPGPKAHGSYGGYSDIFIHT